MIDYEVISKNVTSVGWDILKLLSKFESLKISEIRTRLKLEQVKTQIELARLEGAVLITQTRSEEDKRAINYQLTDHGLDILKSHK